ncbi:MAG: tRNA (guanosine(37)-N1)-methyltransferase TrmD [Lachnospiraceae bacterium]|nr:tRNA (guanosine(37)-N1)-methyltransferase TrmD [Lachnospiraceae bacterium]
MKFQILTLFPEMVMQGLNTSIIGRAVENKLIEIDAVNIRDYTMDKHGKVDDYPYGGGAGMLMQAQPVFDAYLAVTKDCIKKPRTIYVTPQGKTFNQSMAEEFAKEEELVFLCGHYEGIDQRVLDEIVTDYVSIGDYVLTGGELPAMVMIDAIARLVPGVLHNDVSSQTESFYNDLLEYPQYSRPEVWHDKKVPEVLLSGNHKKIEEWRLEQSVALTKERRPDLYKKYDKSMQAFKRLKKQKRKYIHMMEQIAQGRANILYNKGMDILLKDKLSGIYMMSAESVESAKVMLRESGMDERIQNGGALMIVCDPDIKELLIKDYGMETETPCYQACYTSRETLPVRHKDIRPLTLEHKQYVKEHYHSDMKYIEARINAGIMYGAFVGDKLVGFIGGHREGSMGMLFVEESQRRSGIAGSLEAFVINKLLEQGRTPYCHIYEGNTASFKLQEKMGLYLCDEPLWWIWS